MTCSRKRVKEVAPKTARVSQAGTVVSGEARVTAPLNGGVIDGVLGVLNKGKQEARLDSEAGSEQDESVDDSEDDSEEESAQEDRSGVAEVVPSLDLEEAMMWEMEDNFGKEGAGPAVEWDPSSSRKTEPPPPRGSATAKSSSRGGGNRVGKWTGRDGSSSGASEGRGDDQRRERPVKRSEGGQRGGGQKGGSATGTARNFPGKGEQGKFPGGKGGRGGVLGPGRGKGEGWREDRAASSPSVRSTPYKWTTSDASGTGEVASVLPPLRQPRRDLKPKSGVTEGGGVAGVAGVSDSTGERGFSARFGGGLEGVKGGVLRQGAAAPRAALWWNAERASGTKDSASKREFPPKVVPPSVPLKPLAGSRVKPPGRAPWNKKGGED